jgi:wyosine [tRNA(Phe)-imidazoG37] synthetase (radical SAM superfamily)
MNKRSSFFFKKGSTLIISGNDFRGSRTMHPSQKEILIGKYKHAAYKMCYWTEQSLRTGGRRQCYKHGFGIKSHLCIQSTSFRGCNIACSFCWRDVEGRQHSFQRTDAPGEIAEQLIEEQTLVIERSLPDALSNYENMVTLVYELCKGDTTVTDLAQRCKISRQRTEDALIDLKNAGVVEQKIPDRKSYELSRDFVRIKELSIDESRDIVEKYVASKKDIIEVHLEAARPKHIAISYDGEPTMYTRIGELIDEFRRRGISTFVVTNGTFPERIIEMKENGTLPTQLYVTLAAPDKETYLRVCSSVKPYFPVHDDHWERLNRTLGLLSYLGCRTVVRITSVRGVNMIKPELYREKVQKANPSFLEVKGFSISGNAPRISERLGETNLSQGDPSLYKIAFQYAPTHEEIMNFARAISKDFAQFPLVSESKLNRQALMNVGWEDPSNVEIDFATEI